MALKTMQGLTPTITITGGSAAGSQPGQFYGASGISYELVYIY